MSAADLLKVALPSAAQTDLLRACLWPRPGAAEALARWKASTPDPVDALMGQGALRRRLAPLLRPALEDETGPLAVRVRAGDLYERERSAAFDAAAAETLAIVAPMGPVMLSRGQWLAISAYPASHLRHRHDLDLLARPDQSAPLQETLVRAGFRQVAPGHLTHPGGLPVLIHTHPVDVPSYDLDLWTGARTAIAYGAAVLTPAPHALIAHILVQAATQPSRQSLLWAADAWFALQAGAPDWDALAAMSARTAWGVHVAHGLNWLATDLGLEAPAQTPDVTGPQLREALRAIGPTAGVRAIAPFARDFDGRLALLRLAALAAARRLGWPQSRQQPAQGAREQ